MDNIEIIQKMQDFIKEHIENEDFKAQMVCDKIGYSRRQIDRLLNKYLGQTLKEYIDAIRLTKGAYELIDSNKSVLEIALDHHYKSHEGFTRSFSKRFQITPMEYRMKKLPIPLFIQYPISHYHVLLDYKEENNMDQEVRLCMVNVQTREKRKLIYLPSKNAGDYFSYCEEMGCEWEGLLNSVIEKMDTAALIELPDCLVEEGYSKVASGIEVPLDFDKPLPENYKMVELEACLMVYFQSEPYENEEDFCTAIDQTYEAIKKYKPELYGYQQAFDIAPSFNFGANAKEGAKLAIPVISIQ